ncbi:MAG: creatininase family protein [Rhodospirillales bacterium]|nr:creatininase family protein [Rhodospirillales bacterium]
MRLQLCTWLDVEAYLKRSSGIIMPIGSTEQHGPTGFIGTDAICPELIAAAMAEKLDVMIAPTINVGMAQHHLGFPGSIALRPTTLIAVICDHVKSLARHGFDRFFFINGHGGNTPSMHAAFSEIYAEKSFGGGGDGPSVRCELHNWWKMPSVKKITDEEFKDAEGFHATVSEVALTYHGYPEDGDRVKLDTLDPTLAPVGPIFDADDFRARFPDGRIGSDPTLATPELGKRFLEAVTVEMIEDYNKFLAAD